MRLASVRFRPGVQHPPGVLVSREVVASDRVHLELSTSNEVTLHVPATGAVRVYSSAAWESYEPAPGCLCTVCLAPLDETAKGQTCSKSCAAKLRYRRKA